MGKNWDISRVYQAETGFRRVGGQQVDIRGQQFEPKFVGVAESREELVDTAQVAEDVEGTGVLEDFKDYAVVRHYKAARLKGNICELRLICCVVSGYVQRLAFASCASGKHCSGP